MATVTSTPPQKLSIGTKLAFGVGDLGAATVAAVFLLSIPVVVKYPITRRRYAEIRTALEARHAG